MAENADQLLYVQTSGIDSPERLYAPFILAQTAKTMDVEPALYFVGMGLTVLKSGEAKKIQLGELPSLAAVIEQTLEMEIPFYVCQQSMQLLSGMEGGFELIDGVTIVGAATLNDLVLESDGTMWF